MEVFIKLCMFLRSGRNRQGGSLSFPDLDCEGFSADEFTLYVRKTVLLVNYQLELMRCILC